MKQLFIAIILTLIGVSYFISSASNPDSKTETVVYVVNMQCQNCVEKLTDRLSFLKGVKDFKISLINKTIIIKFDPSKVEENKFVEIIEKLGYTATKQQSEIVDGVIPGK